MQTCSSLIPRSGSLPCCPVPSLQSCPVTSSPHHYHWPVNLCPVTLHPIPLCPVTSLPCCFFSPSLLLPVASSPHCFFAPSLLWPRRFFSPSLLRSHLQGETVLGFLFSQFAWQDWFNNLNCLCPSQLYNGKLGTKKDLGCPCCPAHAYSFVRTNHPLLHPLLKLLQETPRDLLRASDRDDTAIRCERSWWYHDSLRASDRDETAIRCEQSRWYCESLKVSDCDDTAIHWERSRWYCDSLRAIAIIPWVDESEQSQDNRNSLRASDRDDTEIIWERSIAMIPWNRIGDCDEATSCTSNGDDTGHPRWRRASPKMRLSFEQNSTFNPIVDCRWQDVGCVPQQMDIAIGTVWKRTNQQDGFIKSEQTWQ